jgi:hypothetical protein
MTSPIDVIANAIRVGDGNHTMGAGQLAEVAAGALTDEQIVRHAAEQLAYSPTAGRLTLAQLETLARIVLRSVGGG